MQVKICGITRTDDAMVAVEAGADAIGLIFYAGSKRFVNPDTAADIISNVSPYTSIVGLFVNADAEYVQTVLNYCPLSQLQFHGDESPDFCSSFNRPYVKSVPVSRAGNMSEIVAAHRNARLVINMLFQVCINREVCTCVMHGQRLIAVSSITSWQNITFRA